MDAATGRRDLYPELEPYASGMLGLDGLHKMYWEESGNPSGLPAVFLHGGPGAGAAPVHRRFFDPEVYRIVIFDQRGCGRSKPLGEIRANTTAHLVADIERLRSHLGIEKWLVFGGSWGSLLALAYGQAHPERCLGFVLRGIFTGRPVEIDWFLGGARAVFPEPWQALLEPLPVAERGDPLGAYRRRLNHADPAVHVPAARAWCRYEAACSTLLPTPGDSLGLERDRTVVALARIETHYLANGCFIPEDFPHGGLDRLRGIPATLVHGRYDMVCPLASADALARAWPEADYRIVPDAGHSAMEPGIRAALVAATDRFRAVNGT